MTESVPSDTSKSQLDCQFPEFIMNWDIELFSTVLLLQRAGYTMNSSAVWTLH